MIKTYKYITTSQSKLHGFVTAFFNRIEFETGTFTTGFYVREFYNNLVSRHPDILGKAFEEIYATIIKNKWKQDKRTKFCAAIRNSNEIKTICAGKIIPWKETDIPIDVRAVTKKLFIELYDKVLKGKVFQPIYGTRKEHYHTFKRIPQNDLEFCPSCGIVLMHTYEDDITDQYDHYLSKDTYPFSSVNFENLVPICADCNSFQTKSNTDILSYSKKVFYPFDEQHKPIEITISIEKNHLNDLSKIKWKITYECSDGKLDEIAAWKKTYKIERRHLNHLKGSIINWYTFYWRDFTHPNSIKEIPDPLTRTKSYLRTLRNRNIIEYKSLTALLISPGKRAISQTKAYARY